MKRSDIASVLRITVLAVVLLLGDCWNDTGIELMTVNMSCNSLTAMGTIPRGPGYRHVNFSFIPALPTKNWIRRYYTNKLIILVDITQLMPGSTYTVRVRVTNPRRTYSKGEITFNFTTLPRTAIGDNVTVVPSTNSLGIENKLSDVNITCRINGSDTVKNITISGMSRKVVDRLSPNTTYSVDCAEVDKEGQYQCMEYNGTVTTLLGESPTVPGQPTNIGVNTTCNSLTLSWLPPGEDGGSNVTDYNVTVVDGTSNGPLLESVPTGGNTAVRITSLKPNTMYTVHIRARNSAGLGPPAVVNVTTEELKVSKVYHNSVSATEVIFRLLETSGNFKCTVLEESTNRHVLNSTVSAGIDVKIDTLTPNTTYSIRCTGIEDQCVEVDVMFTTATIKVPGQPTNIAVNTTCNSLTLSWLPPGEDGGSDVTDYIVTVVDGTEDGPLLESVATGGNTAVRITSLKANTMYTVHIRARNSAGLGPPAVVNVTTKNLKSSKVDYKSELAKEVTVRLRETSGNFKCTVFEKSTNRHVFNSTVSAGKDVIIDRLTPNTTYSIRCTGIEDQCVDFNERVTTAIIKGITPGAPNITLNMTTCTNITLHWIPPNSNGEEIQEYDITYYTGGELVNSVAVPGDHTSATLRNLKPNTMYTIQVRARNSEGAGDADSVDVTTKGRAKGDDSLHIGSLSGSSLQFSHTLPQPVYYTCERGGSTEQFNITEKGYNLTGLRPDRIYTIDCVAYLNGVDYCLEVNTSARTAPDEVDNLTVVGLGRVDGDWIHQSISWRRPSNHTSQLNYTIRYGPSSVGPTHPSVNTTTSSNTTVILTLPIPTKQTVYNVWVAAVSDVGQGEYRMTKFTYKKPSPPENITVINKTCNSRSVQWSPPSDTGGLEITGYMVNVAKNSFTTNATMTRTDITNLSPKTTYQVKVVTITVFNSRSISIDITTQSRNELQLHLHPFSSTGLNLTISPPHNKDGVNYTCTLSPGNRTLSGNVTLTDLSPNTTFSVRCLVYENGEDLCYEGIGNGRTFPSVTGREPTNVRVTATTSDQFTVKWGPPRGYVYNQDTRGYNVKYWRATGSEDDATTNNVTTTTFTATGLDTNTVYTFRVASYTEEGIGVYSEPVKISTIPTVENITPNQVSTTTAVIQWKGVHDIYSIWLTVTVDDDFGYGRREFEPFSVTGKTNSMIENLNPFRSYTIEMHVVGELGNGSKKSVSFRTLGSAPTKAPQLLPVQTDKREATLQWRIPPVSGRNGIITSYEIHWKSANTQTSPIIHNVSQPNFTHPEQISRTIQGLAPYTTYTWRVAAVNVNGTGRFSASESFTTEEDVPEVVTDLSVTDRSSCQVTVKWKPPSTPNGVIIHYEVCTWILDRDKCSQKNSTTATEETITGLDSGVPYRVSVTAYTSAGPGPENTLNEIIFTKELPPEQTVTNITIKWISATTVNISWIPLGMHQARGFPSYRVIIISEGTLSAHRTTTESSVLIGGLDGNRVYTFIVQPLTGGGPRVWSEPVLIGKRLSDKLQENDNLSTGIGLFIGGIITGVLATLLGGVLVWVLVRKCVAMRVRYKSNRNKSTNEDRKTDSPSYDTVEMQRKDESGRNYMARDEVMYEEVDVVKMDSNPAYVSIQFHKSVL